MRWSRMAPTRSVTPFPAATRKAMTIRGSCLFFSAHPARAVLEVFIVGMILWLGLLLLQEHTSSFILPGISPLIGLSCMLLYASRLQLSKGPSWQQSILEASAASVLGFVFSGIALASTFVLLRGAALNTFWRSSDRPFLFAAIVLTLNVAVFVIFRSVVYLLPFWNRLRRKQLLWALTHAHIMVLALGAGLLILLLDGLVISISRRFAFIVPATLALIILSAVALVAIVPPLALFSYLVVRRTTSRLKTLAAATSALRSGNYAIHVPVVGEDEVAQLQTDFNAMATDLERAMRQLHEERDTVAGLLQARRELIVNVSHELRTPVATLRSYLETTLNRWDESSQPTLQHDLQVMENEVIRLQALIEDLFLLSRAEVGRLTLRCEPTNVEVLVLRIVETAAPLVWRASRIELVADIPSELPLALVDASRLEQVLQNLLHNGVRHTSPGGIVAVMVTAASEAVVLQVKDTGEGIAAEDLPRIWERFYQTESARTRMGGGTGLGLALVKEWIEGMNGTVAVESVVGEGSCFTIRLPRTGAA